MSDYPDLTDEERGWLQQPSTVSLTHEVARVLYGDDDDYNYRADMYPPSESDAWAVYAVIGRYTSSLRDVRVLVWFRRLPRDQYPVLQAAYRMGGRASLDALVDAMCHEGSLMSVISRL